MPSFCFHRAPSLPRLAWCASLTAVRDVVDVWHGPWVETTSTGFVEGAWDGDFAAGRFDQAPTLYGSGGLLDGSGWLFAAPTHMMTHLFVMSSDGRLLISNSLAFLLTQANDSLDPTYARYYFDFLRHRRRGLRQPPGGSIIATAQGRRICFYSHTNLSVLPDLSLHARSKAMAAAPADFHSYRNLLQTSLQRLIANAADPQRSHCYRPLVALSQGLDSPAVAKLAVEIGCRQAFTIVTPEGAGLGDHAAPLAEMLGLEVTVHDRHAYQELPNAPEAEFCAGMAFGAWTPLAGAERLLEGTLLLMGSFGDDLWTTAPNKVLPDLLAPTEGLVEGSSVTEFRLRAGFMLCPAPWIGAVHGPAIYRISTSPAMRPWRVQGKYDRPIPRRIAEEAGPSASLPAGPSVELLAGLPRTAFGQHKVGGLHRMMSNPDSMSPAGRSDFEAFLAAKVRLPGAKPWDGVARAAARLQIWIVAALRRLPQSLYLRCMPLAMWSLRDRCHPSWHSPYLYTFHWGLERTQPRYRIQPRNGAEL